ncbi:MAG: hypothetical protein ACE5KU_03520 [Nitrososphaerales archaeon]
MQSTALIEVSKETETPNQQLQPLHPQKHQPLLILKCPYNCRRSTFINDVYVKTDVITCCLRRVRSSKYYKLKRSQVHHSKAHLYRQARQSISRDNALSRYVREIFFVGMLSVFLTAAILVATYRPPGETTSTLTPTNQTSATRSTATILPTTTTSQGSTTGRTVDNPPPSTITRTVAITTTLSLPQETTTSTKYGKTVIRTVYTTETLSEIPEVTVTVTTTKTVYGAITTITRSNVTTVLTITSTVTVRG